MKKYNFKKITKHYKNLIRITKQHYFIGITNEWIVDNYYLIVEKENEIKLFYKKKHLFKNINLLNILEHISEFRNYKIDQVNLIENIKDYCKKNNIQLTYQEIKIIPITLSIILINKIKQICEKEAKKIKEKNNIENIIEKIKRSNKINLSNYLNNDFYNSSFAITYFNDNIKKLGDKTNCAFKQFNKLLEEKNIILRNLIDKEHLNNTNENILIANIFYSLKQINSIELEYLFHNLWDAESILSKDPYYDMMTLETKNMYRIKLIKMAKKEKITPYKLAVNLINLDKNIGNLLFKEKNLKLRTKFYLFLVTSLSVLFTLVLSNYFIPTKWLGFIILLIPVSEIVITFLNKIYLKIYPPKPLAKLDFEKGIPKNYKTMVVVPTILKDKDKVDEIFKKL